MSTEDLTRIPEQVVAGTEVSYRRTFSDFPASASWTLRLYLSGGKPSAPVSFSKAFSADGDSFTITLTATETATLSPGNYRWEERATLVARVERADYDVLEVLPNIATAAALDMMSPAERQLAAVRASLDLRLGVGSATAQNVIEEYGIGARRFIYMPTKELKALETALAAQVNQEADPGKGPPQMLVRFSSVNAEPWPR